MTLELLRDASVFGYVEDEGIVEEKFLSFCLIFLMLTVF